MQALIIENELLRVTVLAGRGSDIVEFRYKPLDLDFMYCRHRLRNPAQRHSRRRSPMGRFFDYY